MKARRVNELIRQHLAAGGAVDVSFDGIELVLSSFLNAAIGQLYKDMDADYVAKNVLFSGLSNGLKEQLERTRINAIRFFEEPARFEAAYELLPEG